MNKTASNQMNEESELIARAQEGDKKAMALLVKEYEQTVYNFAFKVCRNKDKAEHTMQETFLNMVRKLHQFDRKSKLSTWLYTIVSNNCLMLARSNKKYSYASLDDEDAFFDEKEFSDWSVTPNNLVENEELKSILDEAIQKLAPEYRVVFLLRDVEGLSTEETGKITDLTVPAVKSRLHRARAFLRNEIDKKLKHAN